MKFIVSNPQEYMIPCISKKLFGIECLGCGSQRALLLIAQGDFTAAFIMYPPIYTMLAFFGFVLLHFTDKKRNYHSILITLALINALVMIFSYIYKLTN